MSAQSVKIKEEKLSQLGVYKEGMPWNPVEKTIMERRSIRRYKKDPLPDGMIQRILEAGRFAPSAGNYQPWKFIVINSREILDEMEKDIIKMCKIMAAVLDYTKGGRLRRFLLMPIGKMFMRLLPNELNPIPYGLLSQIAQEKAPVFHQAPTLILLLEDKRGVACPSTDIGICGQSMTLAAHSMGAGSCWIGLARGLNYLSKWKKKLGIKFPYQIRDGIIFGWQSPKADGEVPRETQIVQWFDGGMEDPPKIVKQGE